MEPRGGEARVGQRVRHWERYWSCLANGWRLENSNYIRNGPSIRHQEHLYNVNVMEMSTHKEALKWLLFIG